MISPKVRVRFAPSPTGYLHVGGARTVLFNWLYAKHTGGTMVLRVEDTDRERSTLEAEQMQIQDIKWLGLLYDEGPDVGGPYPPYRQSERLEIYAKHAGELLDNDKAYYCFCSEELLDQKREAAMATGLVAQYDKTCARVSRAEAEKRREKGEKAVVRFRATEKDYKLDDEVRGEIVFPANMVGDFVMLRQDGMPVYNYCCVVDDHLMKITHVIRAEEHLSNTLRQMMLYEAFGWELPRFAHASLILGSDRQKLSKRHGATSVNQYMEEGYLPEALLNFLVLLGWSSPNDKEIMSLDEMVSAFGLERINKSPSVFDSVKLNWMNGEYIKNYPLSKLTDLAMPFIEKAGLPVTTRDRAWLEKTIDVVRPYAQTLAQIPIHMKAFIGDTVTVADDAQGVKDEPTYKAVVDALKAALAQHVAVQGDAITGDEFAKIQDQVKTTSGAKGKGLFMPMRVALTGQGHGPDLKLVVPLLGAKLAVSRVEKSG